MITAEQWLNAVGEAVGQDMFCGDPHKPGSRSEDIIKRIQLDAYKEGMTEAAQIVNTTSYVDESKRAYACLTFASIVKTRIEKARDSKTSL